MGAATFARFTRGSAIRRAPSERPPYLLMWKSDWENLPLESKSRLQHLLTSNGTGPKGEDPLVFVLVKPPNDAATVAKPGQKG